LNAFAVPNVEFIDPDESLLIDRLVIPNHAAPSGHFREDVIRGVRDLLVERYGGRVKTFRDRLYISRGRAPKRKISNEEEVQTVLREFGFQVIYAEDHSFEEQIAMAAQARHLVSNHGAGLTNMLFMPPGNNVLELRHETDRVNNCYFVLASALNLNYYYQTCPPENPNEDPHGADLRVDVEALRKNIELMLGS
jgi:capsular polysaccharide biosynthesis protein